MKCKMQNSKCKSDGDGNDVRVNSVALFPSPLWGEGRRERSERGVRGGRTELKIHAPAPHPRPLSPERRGENKGLLLLLNFEFCIL